MKAYPFYEHAFRPNFFQMGKEPSTLVVRSVLNGGIQTQEAPGARWTVSMVLAGTGHLAEQIRRSAQREAFWDSLNGQQERVALWPWHRIGRTGVRGTPWGTVATSGVQVNENTAQFATAVPLKNMGANATLEAGDFIAVNGQLIQAPERVVADGSGIGTIGVPGGLRAAAAANDAVTTNRPTALFVLADPNWRASYTQHGADQFAADFIEVFA